MGVYYIYAHIIILHKQHTRIRSDNYLNDNTLSL